MRIQTGAKWMILAMFVMSVPTISWADAVICNSKAECKEKIEAARTQEGGALCFSPDVWVPRPPGDYPEKCQAEFVCGQFKAIAARAYFKEIRHAQEWVKDSDTKPIIASGFYVLDTQVKSVAEFGPWAFDAKSGDVSDQGEVVAGTLPGKTATAYGKNALLNAVDYCGNPPANRPVLELQWEVFATKQRKTGKIITRFDEASKTAITEPELDLQRLTMAKGKFAVRAKK